MKQSPHARIEVIGKSVQGRDLFLITVTDFARPDAEKKTIWLQARQHAWEGGTSYVAEGALRHPAAALAAALLDEPKDWPPSVSTTSRVGAALCAAFVSVRLTGRGTDRSCQFWNSGDAGGRG